MALVVSSLSILWGLLLSTKVMGRRPGPRWILDLHRWFAGTAITFTAIHVGALLLDGYTSFGPLDVLVPGWSEWRPGAVAWGVVAMWLLVAIHVTSLFMSKLPRRLWRFVHLGSYLVFFTAVMHGATAGTDATNLPYVGVVIGLVAATTLLTIYRIVAVRRQPSRTPLASV